MLRINSPCTNPALSLRTDMDQLIADVFGTQHDANPTIGGRRGQPAVDVWEENDDYFVALDIPGLNQGEVKITALGRDLTLEGIPMDAKEQNEGAETEQMANPKFTYFHRERNHRAFHRVIRFPFEVDVEHVAGHLEAGVLTIRVPKAASAKPRKIDIQTR